MKLTPSDDVEMDKQVEDGIDEVLKVISETTDKKLMSDFFRCLFTPAELYDIGKRWLLVKEIDKGTTQREIAKKFKMSLCKITRGSKELKKKDSAFYLMLNKVQNK